MIQFAKLNLSVPLERIRNDVDSLTKNWIPHFNQHDYAGEWTVISLRSPSGQPSQIVPDLMGNENYKDTELMQQCPAIRDLVSAFECDVMSVRLMNLKPGSVIKEHRDLDLSFENGEARFHIPVFTNKEVFFYSRDTRIIMNVGECWYVNVNMPHRVSNEGQTDRIHLVIDCKVNAWIKDWFSRSDCATVPDENKNDLAQIIRELRLQNTETANRIAEELERQS